MNYQIEPLQTENWPQVRALYMRKVSVPEFPPLTPNLQTGKTGIPVAYHPVVLSHGMENIFMAG
jgi:hypothetical protein